MPDLDVTAPEYFLVMRTYKLVVVDYLSVDRPYTVRCTYMTHISWLTLTYVQVPMFPSISNTTKAPTVTILLHDIDSPRNIYKYIMASPFRVSYHSQIQASNYMM